MERLFADPRRPLLEQAVPKTLSPLPLGDVADYVGERFRLGGRDAGDALAALLEFSRGHPQRSMLLAHYLWEATEPGTIADETQWTEARESALEHAAGYLGATWRSWATNERPVALALATTPGGPYTRAAQAEVGIKKSSVRYALQALVHRADAIPRADAFVLTDPLLELWLQRHEAAR